MDRFDRMEERRAMSGTNKLQDHPQDAKKLMRGGFETKNFVCVSERGILDGGECLIRGFLAVRCRDSMLCCPIVVANLLADLDICKAGAGQSSVAGKKAG